MKKPPKPSSLGSEDLVASRRLRRGETYDWLGGAVPQTSFVCTFEECGHVALRDNQDDQSLGAMARKWLGKVFPCDQCGGIDRTIGAVRVDSGYGVKAERGGNQPEAFR